MPEALGAAPLEGLPDRGQPERFAGVDGYVEVLAADVLEGVEVRGGPLFGLGPRDVEADDTRIAPADRAFGDLDRTGRLAHGRHEHLHDDRVAGWLRVPCPDREDLEVGRDDLVERQATFRREFRSEADLRVDQAVSREVL